jgi:hypothetical protein
MLQNWIHTNLRTNGSAAAIETRFSGSQSMPGLCVVVNFENSDYQPKPEGGLDRLEVRKI